MARGPKLKMGKGWFKYIVLKTWKPGFQMFYDADADGFLLLGFSSRTLGFSGSTD